MQRAAPGPRGCWGSLACQWREQRCLGHQDPQAVGGGLQIATLLSSLCHSQTIHPVVFAAASMAVAGDALGKHHMRWHRTDQPAGAVPWAQSVPTLFQNHCMRARLCSPINVSLAAVPGLCCSPPALRLRLVLLTVCSVFWACAVYLPSFTLRK